MEIKEGQIDIDDVSFSYDEHTEVLTHVTLHIEPGQKVAVVAIPEEGRPLCASLYQDL